MLEEDEGLYLDSEDLQSAFNLFSVPDQWLPYFSYSKKVDGSAFGLEAGKLVRPALSLIPMGWHSAVGLVQEAVRDLVFRRAREISAEKGKPLPAGKSLAIVYIDNFDEVEIIKRADMDFTKEGTVMVQHRLWWGRLASEWGKAIGARLCRGHARRRVWWEERSSQAGIGQAATLHTTEFGFAGTPVLERIPVETLVGKNGLYGHLPTLSLCWDGQHLPRDWESKEWRGDLKRNSGGRDHDSVLAIPLKPNEPQSRSIGWDFLHWRLWQLLRHGLCGKLTGCARGSSFWRLLLSMPRWPWHSGLVWVSMPKQVWGYSLLHWLLCRTPARLRAGNAGASSLWKRFSGWKGCSFSPHLTRSVTAIKTSFLRRAVTAWKGLTASHWAPECKTYSAARGQPIWTTSGRYLQGPSPFRSPEQLWGFQHLTRDNQIKVRQGNAMAKRSLQGLKDAHERKRFASLEHPWWSHLWSYRTAAWILHHGLQPLLLWRQTDSPGAQHVRGPPHDASANMQWSPSCPTRSMITFPGRCAVYMRNASRHSWRWPTHLRLSPGMMKKQLSWLPYVPPLEVSRTLR